MLSVLTCGSVDDGKSTLLGHLFALHGAIGDASSFANAFDGLEAEREQGITIDIAHRQLDLGSRRLRFLDAPGHEQYVRNMFSGAANADAALLIVDATRGLSEQTRRHARLARLAGVLNFALVVTKMDMVDHDRTRYEQIVADFADFAATADIESWDALPISGLTGANIIERGSSLGWYDGPTLSAWLEAASIPQPDEPHVPVQLVQKDGSGQRWLLGPFTFEVGDTVRIEPSGEEACIAEARPGAVRLDRDVDCGRGDILGPPETSLTSADQVEAALAWLGDDPLVPGRRYALKLGTARIGARVRAPRYRVALDDGEQRPAKTLETNEIGLVEIQLAGPLAYDVGDRALARFILIDEARGETVAAGRIERPLARAVNVRRQPLIVDRARRADLMGQKPAIIWLTGLSGAGKSTIANLVEEELARLGKHSFLLDGDNLRLGLNKDLSFSEADRIENIRRIGEVAKLMADAGLIVLTAFISPFRDDRDRARRAAGDHPFYEVHVDTPIEVAEARDAKGLYARARAGEIADFTGISSPYEAPQEPDIVLPAAQSSAEDCAAMLVARLKVDGLL